MLFLGFMALWQPYNHVFFFFFLRISGDLVLPLALRRGGLLKIFFVDLNGVFS